jgi:hypothetical protein
MPSGAVGGWRYLNRRVEREFMPVEKPPIEHDVPYEGRHAKQASGRRRFDLPGDESSQCIREWRATQSRA